MSYKIYTEDDELVAETPTFDSALQACENHAQDDQLSYWRICAGIWKVEADNKKVYWIST